MSKLKLDITTPEGIVFTDEVDEVTAPTIEGEVGILPGHIPIFTKVKPGEIRVKKGSQTYFLASTGGFLEVLANNVNVLANYAVRAENIEVAQVEEAKKRAEKLLLEKKDKKEQITAQADLQKAILELKVARRRKYAGRPTTPPSLA